MRADIDQSNRYVNDSACECVYSVVNKHSARLIVHSVHSRYRPYRDCERLQKTNRLDFSPVIGLYLLT